MVELLLSSCAWREDKGLEEVATTLGEEAWRLEDWDWSWEFWRWRDVFSCFCSQSQLLRKQGIQPTNRRTTLLNSSI